MKVKIFCENNPESLEDEMNEWLEQSNIKVLGIHYTSSNRFESNFSRIFSALVSFEEIK